MVAATLPATVDNRPLVPEIIEQLGFGLAQVRAGVCGGGVYFADGAELLLISAVTDAVAQQWGMSHMQKGLVVTVVFVGILVGNLTSGPLADMYGRRQLILLSFLGIFVFSILSSITVNFGTLSLVRFFVGAAFGLGQPAWNTLGAEITPSDYRVGMQGISQSFFIMGEIYSTLLIWADDPSMEKLHWRWLLQMGAIPAAIFLVLSLLLLHQSPSFLAVSGKTDDAKAILESMRSDNGRPEVSVDFKVHTNANQLPARMRRNSRRVSVQSRGEFWRQMGVVFGPDLCMSTLINMYSCFVLNFMYYGCLYAFPQVLAASSEGGGAALELLIGAVWEIPGQVLGIVVGLFMRRKPSMKLYLLLTGVSTLLFALGITHQGSSASLMRKFGFYGIKCFVDIGFVVIYQYAIEIYPTKVRTTGSAVAVGSGRLAGIISPLIFELIKGSASPAVFFYILLGLVVFNILVIDLLRYETFGVALKDVIEDVEEAKGGAAKPVNEDEASPLSESNTNAAAIVPEPFHVR